VRRTNGNEDGGCRHRFFGFFSYFSALVQSHKFLDDGLVNHQTNRTTREMSKITERKEGKKQNARTKKLKVEREKEINYV